MDISFETDTGSLGIIAHLTGAGREILYGYLRNCASMHSEWSPTETKIWNGIHFERDDVTRMHMERRHSGKHLRILTTIDFVNGVRWKGGSLRLPDTIIPDTIANSLRGRPLEEVVEGAPIAGYRIMHAIPGRAAGSTTLRVKAEGQRTGPIPYRAPRRW